jgi:hypothetical protein
MNDYGEMVRRLSAASRSQNTGGSELARPILPITPEISRRMKKRLENAGDDEAAKRVIRDAAKYGVDWSQHGPK